MGGSQSVQKAGTVLKNIPQHLNNAVEHMNTMTGHVNNIAGSVNALQLAMQNVRGQPQGTLGGGCDCEGGGFFGGGDTEADPAKELREYSLTLSAKTKENIIRRLARALSNAGLKINPEDDLDEIVKNMVRELPNEKNGKTFASSAKAQETVCKAIAQVLNDEFTPSATTPSQKFIDTTMSPEVICLTVNEWAHSFAAGVNTEFLNVYASVRNSLQSVQILDQVMRNTFNSIKEKVSTDEESKSSRELEPLIELYNRANSERTRQEEMLKNILNIQLAPAMKELEIAMRDSSDQNAMIRKLGVKPGSSTFASILASTVSSLGSSAAIAQRVHKALLKVGVTISDYLKSNSFTEFQRLLDDKVESREIPVDKLGDFLKATEILRTNFGQNENEKFQEELRKLESPGYKLGAADDEVPFHSNLIKKVNQNKEDRKVIINSFVKSISRHYEEFLHAVNVIGPKLGKEIPLSESIEHLRDSISRINDMRLGDKRLELALIGRYIDAEARTRKERFVKSLQIVLRACTHIIELSMYKSSVSYFERLSNSINSILKTIDFYSDAINKKFGGSLDDEVDGGADDDVLPEIARSGLSLSQAIFSFKYYYYVAQVRENLLQTSGELETYGKKYEDTLGDAVASRLYTIESERKKILDNLNQGTMNLVDGTDVTKDGVNFTHPGNYVDNRTITHTAAGKGAILEAGKTQLIKIVNDTFDAKTKFYKVLQAMELYMKEFTIALAKKPDDVRDIKKMLDGTQVIARWFNEETGNSIFKAFEYMNTAGEIAAGENSVIVPNNDKTKEFENVKSTEHYYDKITDADLGIPQLGTYYDAPGLPKVRQHINDTFDYFQGLKNLINAFIRIGDIFGGEELKKKIFMSPSQMYKYLSDYLKMSTLSIQNQDYVISLPITGNINSKRFTVKPKQIYFSAINNNFGEPTGAGDYQAQPTAIGGVVPLLTHTLDDDQRTFQGNFAEEHKYFTMIIKSMAAKILTTLGVYDMFERNLPLNDLTPTRMIIGGGLAANEDPEVLDEAAELYFRLPRLAEFYRSFLKWQPDAGTTEIYKICLIPELEGVFSKFIQLIFTKIPNIDNGDYSDSEMRQIIVEINNIYTFFKNTDPENPIKTALKTFVSEINRRYGLVKKDEMMKYWDAIKSIREKQSESTQNNTNYMILPDEDVDVSDRRAPSDKYAVDMIQLNPSTKSRYENKDAMFGLNEKSQKLISDFRKKLEENFTTLGKSPVIPFSFLIKQAETEIRTSNSSEVKLRAAFRIIQGSNNVNIDNNKAFMFHETVGVGLATLNALYGVIKRYQDLVENMDPFKVQGALMDAIYLAAKCSKINKDNAFEAVNAVKIKTVRDNGAGGPGDDGNNIDPGFFIANGNKEFLLNLIKDYIVPLESTEVTQELGLGNITKFDRYIVNDETVINELDPLLNSSHIMSLLVRLGQLISCNNLNNAAADGGPGGAAQNLKIYIKSGKPSTYLKKDPLNLDDLIVGAVETFPHYYDDATAGPWVTLQTDAPVADGNPAIRNKIKQTYQELAALSFLLVDRNMMMTDFIEATYDLAVNTNNLIELRFVQGTPNGIQFGFSKLRTCVDDIMTDIKFYMEQFRPHIKDFRKYEDSLRFLEINFIDNLLKQDSTVPTSVEQLSKNANTVLQNLIQPHNYNFRGLTYETLYKKDNSDSGSTTNFVKYLTNKDNRVLDVDKIKEPVKSLKETINYIALLKRANAHDYHKLINVLDTFIDSQVNQADKRGDSEGLVRYITMENTQFPDDYDGYMSISDMNIIKNNLPLAAPAGAGGDINTVHIDGAANGAGDNVLSKILNNLYNFGYTDMSNNVVNIIAAMANSRDPRHIMILSSTTLANNANNSNDLYRRALKMINNKSRDRANNILTRSLNYVSNAAFEKEIKNYFNSITDSYGPGGSPTCYLHEFLYGSDILITAPIPGGVALANHVGSPVMTPVQFLNLSSAGPGGVDAWNIILTANNINTGVNKTKETTIIFKLFDEYNRVMGTSDATSRTPGGINVAPIIGADPLAQIKTDLVSSSNQFKNQISRKFNNIPFLPNIVKTYTYLLDLISSIGININHNNNRFYTKGVGMAPAANIAYTNHIFVTLNFMYNNQSLEEIHNLFLVGSEDGATLRVGSSFDNNINVANAAQTQDLVASQAPHRRIQKTYLCLISSMMNVRYDESVAFVDYVKENYTNMYESALPAALKVVEHYLPMIKNADPSKMYYIAMMQLLVNPFTISFFPGDTFKKVVQKDVLLHNLDNYDEDDKKQLIVNINKEIWKYPTTFGAAADIAVYTDWVNNNIIKDCTTLNFDKKVNFNKALRELVFYNNEIDDCFAKDNLSYKLREQIRTARPGFNSSGKKDDFFPVVDKKLDNETGRFALYDSNGKFEKYRSLMFSFNQLLALYLETNTDIGGGVRIYYQLINSLGNGTLSQAVTEPLGNSFPDIAALGESFGIHGVPKNNVFLFSSLAYIIQRFIKDVNPSSQIHDHLVTTLTDVPLYMKESYRANLPSFVKLFDLLMQKSEFIKHFIQKLDIEVKYNLDYQKNLCSTKLTRKFIKNGNATLSKIFKNGDRFSLHMGIARNANGSLIGGGAPPVGNPAPPAYAHGVNSYLRIDINKTTDNVGGEIDALNNAKFKILAQSNRGDKSWEDVNVIRLFTEKEIQKIPLDNIKSLSPTNNLMGSIINLYLKSAYLHTMINSIATVDVLVNSFINKSTNVDDKNVAAFLLVSMLENRLDELGPYKMPVSNSAGKIIDPGRREMFIIKQSSKDVIYGILNAVMLTIKTNLDEDLQNQAENVDLNIVKISGYLSAYNEECKNHVQSWWEENYQYMWFQRGTEVVSPDDNYYTPKALNAIEYISHDVDLISKINAITDNISVACYTALNAATEVLKELGDIPIYGQTQEGSLEMYKMRYDHLPLTPFSSAMSLLGDVCVNNDNSDNPEYYSTMIHPDKTMGTPGFKNLYSNRCLLAKKHNITYDTMPGVKGLVDRYNLLLPKRDQMDLERYLRYVQNVSTALRFVVDVRNYKSSLTTSAVIPIGSKIDGKRSIILQTGMTYDNDEDRLITQLKGGISPKGGAVRDPISEQDLLSIIENPLQSEEIDKIAQVVSGKFNTKTQTRQQELINNLIDMNIIPINVHALMRDIPLANLYNYDYTFNQMVSAIYGKDIVKILSPTTTIADTQEMFVKLLVEPYCNVTMDEYGINSNGADRDAFVARIFRGDNALGLGRPKFLADQLFNKCLFGSIYKDQTSDPDGGPIANIGSSRTDKQDHLKKVVKNLTDAMDNFINEVSELLVFGAGHDAKYNFNRPEGVAHHVGVANIGVLNNANAYLKVYEVFKKYNFNSLLKSIYNSLSNIIMQDPTHDTHKKFIVLLLGRTIKVLNALSSDNHAAPIGAAPINPTIGGMNAAFIGFNNTALTADVAIPIANLSHTLLINFVCHCSKTIRPNAGADESGRTLRNVLHNFANKSNTAHGSQDYRTYDFSSSFDESDTLSYMKHEDGKDFEIVTKQIAFKDKLNNISKLRFDTHFIRNLFFITNINRVVRQKLNRDLTQSRNVLVSSHDAVNPGITEYGFDPYSPNEVYSDKQWSDK